MLPLPMRSRKYQEGPDAAERRPREGGHSPLDSADVRVQVPRTVGSFSSGSSREPRGASTAHPGQQTWELLQGAEGMSLAVPRTWWALGLLAVQGQCLFATPRLREA